MDVASLFTRHLFQELLSNWLFLTNITCFVYIISGRDSEPLISLCLQVMITVLEQVVTMVLDSFEYHDHPRLRRAGVNAIAQLSTYVGLDLLPYLAKAICKARDPRVRLAAIDAAIQLCTYLGPELRLSCRNFVLPALANAINDDLVPSVRSAAINATIQLSNDLGPDLPPSYHLFVLPALRRAICRFEDPQAASAMINISMKHPLATSPYLRETVGTLLEEHASYRLEILELRVREENIAWHEIRISTIEILVMLFEVELPHDIWTSTFNSLSPEQQVEFSSILENGI